MRTIEQLAQALEQGHTTSRALVEDSLARILDPAGEGARAFIRPYAEFGAGNGGRDGRAAPSRAGAVALGGDSGGAEGFVRRGR